MHLNWSVAAVWIEAEGAVTAMVAKGPGVTVRVTALLVTPPEDAVMEVAPARTPVAMSRVAFLTCYPIYFRGEAYLASRQGALAAAEFQKILDHSQLTLTDPVGAMASLGLARAEALSGDRAKSLEAYKTILALWKGADSSLPFVRQAASEFARLRN